VPSEAGPPVVFIMLTCPFCELGLGQVKLLCAGADAQEAIGIPRTSVAIRRNIDTGKSYLNRYTFYSYLISPFHSF
jgi:hypothetical protein